MTNEQVERDLRNRIAAAREWLENDPEPLEDIEFRNHTWTATPVDFLDDPKRVERNGVGFDLSLDSQERDLTVRLQVRIKPEATIGPKDDSPPFVVVYVVNPRTGVAEEITHQHLSPASRYSDLHGLSLDAWFRKWIETALKSRNEKKVMSCAINRAG